MNYRSISLEHSHTDADRKWEIDADNHSYLCTCGEEFEKAPHADGDGDGKCDVCGYQMSAVTIQISGTSDSNTATDLTPPDNNGLDTVVIVVIALGIAVAAAGGVAVFLIAKKKKSADAKK